MSDKQTFQVYCDASGVFAHRFQSIGAISGNINVLTKLRNILGEIVDEKGMKEIKFSGISRYDSREYKAAQGFLSNAITSFIRYYEVRVDVLTWDTTDSRHATSGRDDVENLGRLYYHLLCHITRRFPEAYWDVIIDKDEKVDFDTLRDCLNNIFIRPNVGQFPEIVFSAGQMESLGNIKKVEEVESHKEPLVQLADLFAGIARFSNEKGSECCGWLASYGNPDQYPLPDFYTDEDRLEEHTKSEECRYRLIGELYKICKRYRLGVSLRQRERLWTPNPANPINFWLYEPQGYYDKAPTKGGS